MSELIELAERMKAEGKPLAEDELIHAALLVGNGWPADRAVEESIRTLKDAEEEGGY